MNLLDQLTNFCHPSFSITLLQPVLKQHKDVSRPTRAHSVLLPNKTQDNRHTKSIEKFNAWTPSNKQQTRQKILFKLTRTLSNKVIKNFYVFWVNFQHALKNKKSQPNKQNIAIGIQKMIGCIQSYETKIYSSLETQRSFAKIKKIATLSKIMNNLMDGIQPLIKRHKQSFFVNFNVRQKQILKLQLLYNSIQMLFVNRNIQYTFNKLKRTVTEQIISKSIKNNKIQKQSQKEIAIGDFSVAKSVVVNITGIKLSTIKIKIDENYEPIETYQIHHKSFTKLPIDKTVENHCEACKNLITQRPQIKIQTPSIEKNITEPSEKDTKSLFSYKRSYGRIHLQSQTQFLLESNSKNQINLFQDPYANKKSQYSTPKHRSISTSSIFNVDESRIKKLEKKLFGESKEQSKFQVNGQDWKSDRKALQQIIDNIRSPNKIRRNSTYQFQILNNYPKLDLYRNTTQIIKKNKQNIQILQSEMKVENKKAFLLNNFINNQSLQEKIKPEPKILISLKPKRKQTVSDIASHQLNNNKQQNRQKKHYPQKLKSQIYVGCKY